MHNTTCMTMKRNGREKDEEISAIYSVVPGDVIPVKGGEGTGTTLRRVLRNRGKTRADSGEKETGTEGTAQKSSGFGIHSDHSNATGTESSCISDAKTL